MKKILIIGADGFVGKYLIEHLQNIGTYSIAATKLPTGHLGFSGIDVFDLNILKEDEVIYVLNKVKPDYIVHLAAQSSVTLSWDKPALTVDINIKGSINLLNTVRSLGYTPRILMIGSSEEYGYVKDQEIPICEESHLHPGNIYAATKVCQNMISKIYSKAYDMDIIMVRAFNHIGPRQLDAFVVSDFCRQVAKIEKGIVPPIIKVGNLNVKRDFTDVRDIVKAYELLIKYGKGGEVYNVGSGRAVSIRTILNIILSKSSCDVSIYIDENKFRPADVPIIEADISKMQEMTNWEQTYSLNTTIEDTLNFWRENV